MFALKNRKKQTEPSGMALPDTLTKQEKRQIHSVIEKAKRDDDIPRTAQQPVPLQRIFPDDICRASDRYYMRTVQFQDINRRLVQQEDKTSTSEEWYGFLNFFDSSIHFKLSFMSMATDMESFEHWVQVQPRQDGLNDVRREYNQMLRQQPERGNNDLTETKYLTFGIEAESMKQAKSRLGHVQTDLLNNFQCLGASARALNDKERLHLMHSMFHMGDRGKFYFDQKWPPVSGLPVRDFTTPSSFSSPGGETFQMGSLCGAMSFLSITASSLSDQLPKGFLDVESSGIVMVHVQFMDQNKAIKTIRRTITELDRSKIGEQKKVVRSGCDIDIIPSDLATYGKDAKALLKELQN